MQALVLGGSGLIGGAVARALAGAGYALRLHCHRGEERARERVARLRRDGAVAEVVQADLRTPEGAEVALAGLSRLDLLVCAVGGYQRASLADTTAAMLERLWALNLAVPLWSIRAAAPLLRAAGGQAISILDIAAEQPWRDHVAYAASKAAMGHATRCLALELAPEVRVNAVCPGLVEGAGAVSPARFDRLRRRIPAGRAVRADEIAAAVRLLAEGPRAVTGTLLSVDGGRRLGRSPRGAEAPDE